MTLKSTILTIFAVVAFSTTVFSFNGYESYIEKFNPEISEELIYNIGESTLNAAKEYKFNPILLLAVQKTESHFDVYAFSSYDARGLMQIRVPVWFKTLKKAGLMRTWRDFYDPERNIHSGAFILDHYRKSCSNDQNVLKCALQKYNGDRKGSKYHKKVMKAVLQYHKLQHKDLRLKLAKL